MRGITPTLDPKLHMVPMLGLVRRMVGSITHIKQPSRMLCRLNGGLRHKQAR